MKKIFFLLLLVTFFVPGIIEAHGLAPDSHDAPLTVLDYVELGAITLGSGGLLAYSYWQYYKKGKE